GTFINPPHLAGARSYTPHVYLRRGAACSAPAPTADVLALPNHAYTRLLMDSVPRPGWDPHAIGAARRALQASEPGTL
ncbi:hypothetical protein ACPA74_24775, partial [Uniformispora flossi]